MNTNDKENYQVRPTHIKNIKQQTNGQPKPTLSLPDIEIPDCENEHVKTQEQ